MSNAVWTIILAAGEGSRFGGPKALAPWQSGTLLARAIAAAPAADKAVIVTGAHDAAIKAALSAVVCVHNENWQLGMGSSIASGIKFVAAQGADIALIVPVDQPFVTAAHLSALADRAAREGLCILTLDGDITGPPAAVPKSLFARLSTMTSRGLKFTLDDFGVIEAPGMLRDIDTPEDLAALTAAG